MKQSTRENSRGSELAHSEDDWIVAYENHVVLGGPAPGDFPEDLSDEDKQGLADARQAIDALHGVFSKGRAAAEPATTEQSGHQLGDFQILHEIGRGGMGVVYEAEQISMGRRVALKVLPFAAMLDKQQLNRFKNEARAVGTLDHPNIVTVFSVGSDRGVHYYAMQLVEGLSLAELIAVLRKQAADSRQGSEARKEDETAIFEYGNPPFSQDEVQWSSKPVVSPKAETKRIIQATITTVLKCDTHEFFHSVAKLGIQAAQALDHAHENGIVHRDVKPGNLLLDDDGKLWVADFGLARIEADAGMTMTGDVLGTLRYMSPEQALGKRAVIDHRTDIYSLGATLYELLTLRPIYQNHDRHELLSKIAHEDPPRLRQLDSRIPVDLETIVAKALEKDPCDRYDTAQMLADDLAHYLRGEPIHAKPLTLPGRVLKWVRLNRLITILMVVVMVSLVGLVVGVLWHNRRLNEQLAISDRLRRESTESANRLLRANYVSDMQLTQQAMAKGRYAEARSRLKKYQAGGDSAKVGDFAWHLLSDQLKRSILKFDYRGPLTALATSDVLDVSATGGEDGMLRFFDTATGKQLALIQAHEGNINTLTFAANGTTLASGGDDGYLRVWDTSLIREHGDVELVAKQKAHDDDLLCLAIGFNGKMLASGSADKIVRLWKLESLEPAGELTGHTDWVRSLDFSPDGKTLVSASDDATIRRWDLETRKEVDQFVGHEKFVLSVKYHPTEPLLVSGGKDRTIRLWDLTTGKERQQLSVLNGWVRSLCFSKDGNRIAVAGEDPRVVLLERSPNGQYEQTKVVFTDRSGNQAASFANADRQIVSVGSAGASAWSFGNRLRGVKHHVARGRPWQMVGPSKENSVALVTSHRLITADFQTGGVRDVGLHAEGQYGMEVAIASERNLIAACEFEKIEDGEHQRVFVTDGKGENKRVLFSGIGESNGIDVSPSGQFVAAATPDRTIRIWQAPDFQETVIRTLFESDFAGFLINETGKRLYLLPKNIREMTILDVATSEPVAKLSNVESLLNRTADGRFLAISMTDYSVAIYDTQRNKTIQTLPSHASEVVGGCFSPIEPLLATITNGGQITLWALDTGEMLIQFQAAFHKPPVLGAILGFAADGRTLVAAGGFTGKEKLHYSEIRGWHVP